MTRNTTPLVLLLATGGLLGLNFPFGKLAGVAGIAPAMWSFLISAGCALVLGIVLLARREKLPLTAPFLRFYGIGGIISYAIPNFLVYLSIPHVGSGYTSIMFTLSPVITTILASALNARRPNLLGVIGICIGFAGALLIVLGKGHVGGAESIWIAIAFVIPLSLACGNVYRTLDWPRGATPLPLAVGTNLAAALVLALGICLSTGGLPVSTFSNAPWLSLVQVAASAAMFTVFFQLQIAGGPVYLSQIGYVGAAVGLAAGTLFLNEHYDWITWLGAVVIAAGVITTTVAQKTPSRS